LPTTSGITAKHFRASLTVSQRYYTGSYKLVEFIVCRQRATEGFCDILTACVHFCKSYLPVVSSGVHRVTEELVDHSSLLILHYKKAFLVFLSEQEAGFAMPLVALRVDLWGQLHKESIYMVHPVEAKEESTFLYCTSTD